MGKGYKGFEPGLICMGKKYEENQVYEENGGKICGPGMMRYCKRPLDVLEFYGPVNNRGEMNEFAEVEPISEEKTDDNIKFATKKLKICSKISFGKLVELSVKYDLERTNKLDSQTGDGSGNSQTGHYSGNSQTGYRSGNSQTGDGSGNSQTGHCSGNSQTGYRSGSVQTGDHSSSKQVGNYSAAASTGYKCKIEAGGERCIAIGWGNSNSAKGKIGSYLVLAEWENGNIKTAKMAEIDGETIKEDTWYILKNGEFVEYEGE